MKEEDIINIPLIESIDDSIKYFKEIYNIYTIKQWLSDDRLFRISNIIAHKRPDLISIGIRLNVQVNLFLRTVVTFSENFYIDDMFNDDLGCFALTETKAGVLSGMIVDTTFEENDNNYVISSNKVKKNWISQGLRSKYILTFASNVNNSNDVRIFLIDADKHKDQINRIPIENNNLDICKTLDLAQIEFLSLKINKSALLGKSKEKTKSQLLNSIYFGRIMIAEAVSFSILGLIEYCEKLIIDYPKLKIHNDVLFESKCRVKYLIDNMTFIRNHLIKNNDIDRINSYKIQSVQNALNSYFRLSQLFGIKLTNYPLKYEHLLLNKVAEGDIDVLRVSLIYNQINKGFLKNMLGPITYYQLLRLSYYSAKDLINGKTDFTDSSLVKHIITNSKYYSKRIINSKL